MNIQKNYIINLTFNDDMTRLICGVSYNPEYRSEIFTDEELNNK